MSEKSIRLTIGGRVYPLTVEQHEEKSVLKAAEKINEFISEFKKAYGINDMQDLLAMTALRITTEHTQSKPSENTISNPQFDAQLERLNEAILQCLNS
ncbi:MAG: cell division protein ZapA [Flavobacteriales bacterium]